MVYTVGNGCYYTSLSEALANPSLQAGDIIELRADILGASKTFFVGYGNVSTSGITIMGRETDFIFLDANYSTSNPLRIVDASNVTIKNLAICRSNGPGIKLQGDNFVVDNVQLYRNKTGISYQGGSGLMLKNIYVEGSSHTAINIINSQNSVVQNCILKNNGTAGQNTDGIFAGNGAVDFFVDSCMVIGQKGGSGLDASSGEFAAVNGTFKNCCVLNGDNMGFSASGWDDMRDVVRWEQCTARGNLHDYYIHERITVWIK